MLTIKRNPLISWLVGLLVAYWAFGLLIPGYWLSAFFSAVQLVAGFVVLATALPATADVLRRGEIGRGQLALIGITLFSMGVVYSGGWGLSWSLADNPPSWLGTVYSTFGRALTSAGLGLIFLSPDATPEGIQRPQWWIVVIGVIAVAALAFVLGAQWSEAQETTLTLARTG